MIGNERKKKKIIPLSTATDERYKTKKEREKKKKKIKRRWEIKTVFTSLEERLDLLTQRHSRPSCSHEQ